MTHASKKTTHTSRSALVVPRASALTDRTTTHMYTSPVSDPSELGSEPDSWLEYRYLRARNIAGTRVSRD